MILGYFTLLPHSHVYAVDFSHSDAYSFFHVSFHKGRTLFASLSLSLPLSMHMYLRGVSIDASGLRC